MTTLGTPPVIRNSRDSHVIWRSAACGLWLLAGIIVPFVLLLSLFAIVGEQHLSETASTVIIATIFGVVCAGCAALWARGILRIANVPPSRRAIWLSAITYPVFTILTFTLLGKLERYFVEEGHSPIPLHNLYTALFVPATFIVSAVLGGALGWGLGHRRWMRRLAWRAGLAGALAFLALNVLQDLLGRRVGGPNAAETATMITVTIVCNLAAAMAISAEVGRQLQLLPAIRPDQPPAAA